MAIHVAESVEVRRATLAEKPIIAHLLQLHEHDISAFCDDEINEDGLFLYEDFDLFWTERDRFPYLIRAGGKVAGFALLIEEVHDAEIEVEIEVENGGRILCMFVADYFILKSYRGRGIGKAAAYQLFDQFPGKWQVSELELNLPAQAFWRTIIGQYTAGNYKEWVSDDCFVQAFRSPGMGR